jgi:hypothetical protein
VSGSRQQRRDRCRRMGDWMRWGPSIEARGRERSSETELAVDVVLEVNTKTKTTFTLARPREVAVGWDPYRYRPREPACLSQLTRCHRGEQHSRRQAVELANANGAKDWWQFLALLFLYVFCLIDRVVLTHCKGRSVSFGQVQVQGPGQLPAEARGYAGVLEGWVGGLAWGWLGAGLGLFVRVVHGRVMEGKGRVCRRGELWRAARSVKETGAGIRRRLFTTHRYNDCRPAIYNARCMRWSMDTLDWDRYKLPVVWPCSFEVSTSPVSWPGPLTPWACRPTGRVSKRPELSPCHVTIYVIRADSHFSLLLRRRQGKKSQPQTTAQD